MPKPQLLIDAKEVDLGDVWIHRQDEPYPGGHRYRLWLPDSLAGECSDTLKDLFWLDSVLRLWRREQRDGIAGQLAFVLNTIERMAQAQSGVEIHGECSPHCSTVHCPSCGATIWVNWLFDYCLRGPEDELRFKCKECSAVGTVSLDGQNVSLSSLDGIQVNSCSQVGLTHRFADGLHIFTLGKHKWVL